MCLILSKTWITFLTSFKPLRISDPATRDLQAIAEYTLSEWGAKQKESYLNLVKQSFKALSCSGNIGKRRDEIDQGLYSYSIKKHVVFFRETEDEFMIIRVLHGRMDMEKWGL